MLKIHQVVKQRLTEAVVNEPTTVAMVKSMTNDLKWYKVEKLAVGKWSCDCPRFTFTKADAKGNKFPCKHQRMLWECFKKGTHDINGNLIVLNEAALRRAN
jgi:hypothetical protein